MARAIDPGELLQEAMQAVTPIENHVLLDKELGDGPCSIPEAALELPLTLTTRQAIEFYLAKDKDDICRYDPGAVD